MDDATYERELLRLQTELVKMQEWVRSEGARVLILFEGRDAAGKGGMIARITEYLNPRWCLPSPFRHRATASGPSGGFQRYMAHFPAAGEIAVFDRSWYNRAGVERVRAGVPRHRRQRRAGSSTSAQRLERMLIDDGIILIKYWFSVSAGEQERRFQQRIAGLQEELEAQPGRSPGLRAVGRVIAGQGRHVRLVRHAGFALVGGRHRFEEGRPDQLHPSPADDRPI